MTSSPSNQALRDLWSLGRRFAAFSAAAHTSRFKPNADLLAAISSALEALGVQSDLSASASLKPRERLRQLDELRAAIAEAAARLHGDAARPVFALGSAAAGLERLAKEEPYKVQPEVIEAAREPAAKFLEAHESTEEPVRSELEELTGWCQAIVGGWAKQFVEMVELRQLIDEAFAEGAAPEVSLTSEAPVYDFRSAPLDHVRKMIVLHHVVSTISGIRHPRGSAAMLRGDLKAGAHAYSDQSESSFAVAWNEHGVLGLAFHKYAEGEQAERWLGVVPPALRPLIPKLPHNQPWSCGFWITPDARHRDEYGGGDDGSAYLDALTSAARAALFEREQGWAAAHGLSEEQGEVALELAERAMSGGGAIAESETESLIASPADEPLPSYAVLTEEGLRRAQAAFTQVGLTWALPIAALERERAALRGKVEAAIAAAMSPDERALFDAARSNDGGTVSALLEKGVNADVASVPDQFEGLPVVPGMRPLHVAIRANATQAALALLEGGASPEQEIGGITPLVCAVQAQNVEVARALLARGARAVAQPRFGLLSRAAGQNDVEMVRVLLEAGAELPAPERAAGILAQIRQRGAAEVADLIEAALEKRK